MPPENREPTPTPPNPAAPSSEERNPLKQIRTFQGDVADALGRQNESLYSIQHAERLKMASGGSVPQAAPEDSGRRKEFLMLLIGSAFLLLLGGAGVWYGYNEFLERSAPPIIIAPESRFIPIQSETTVNTGTTTRDTLLVRLDQGWSGTGANELKHLVLRKGEGELAPLTTASEFLATLETEAPGSLVRSLEPAFMFGALGESRFIIFKLSSFENAFAGMLSWEKTLARDLGPLFATAPLLKTIPPESVFLDVISRNKDVRLLSANVASSTEPALLYSFFDRKALIITDDLETLRVLGDRLTKELLSR